MLEILITLAVVVVDQLTKLWAAGALVTQHGGSLTIIEGFLGFRYTRNRGAAFGIFQDGTWFFIIVTVIAVIAICYLLIKKRKSLDIWARLGLALVLAGAVGNLIDRVLLGYVRDMIETLFMEFPVFNVADMAVCVGAAALILAVILEERRLSKEKKQQEAELPESGVGEVKEQQEQGEQGSETAALQEHADGEEAPDA